MGANVWKAVRGAANVLARAPLFAGFAAHLPRLHKPPLESGLPRLLESLEAGGAKVGAGPLRAGNLIKFAPQVLQHDKAPDPDTLRAFEDWARDALRLADVSYKAVAWLRSRLPGYPGILAPQLCPGSPLMTGGVHGEVVWQPGERSRGLHRANAPTGLNQALGIPDGTDFEAEIARVGEALATTDVWARVQDAMDRLSDEDKDRLWAARRRMFAALKPETVDVYEEEALLRRWQYRVDVIDKGLGSLEGTAKEYALAFADADRLIERAAVDVLGQFAAYGDPVMLKDAAELQFYPGTPRTIAFFRNEPPLLSLCHLVCLDDPIVPEILMVTSMTVSFTQAHGLSQRTKAEVLTGSNYP